MRISAKLEDPTHLILQKPLELPVGSTIILEVMTPETAAEKNGFLAASSALLERAYGDDEVDYSTAGEPLVSDQ